MSITLYSPNLGAGSVREALQIFFGKYASVSLPEILIPVFRGTKEEREERASTYYASGKGDLFMVECLRMPNPNGVGAVVVYRTTLRIGKAVYRAIYYTDKTVSNLTGCIDLGRKELEVIGSHVGKTTTLGILESLLQVERFRRFRF